MLSSKQIGMLISTAVASVYASYSQEGNNAWKGNRAYREIDYQAAEGYYRKSQDLKPSTMASYNLANSLYKQKKYEDAARLYSSIAGESTDKIEKAQAYHNLGNSYLKSRQLDKSIEAYKQALRNNPSDEDTRYNLSYAMKLKKQQEEDQKQQQDQQKDQQQDQNEQQKQQQDQQQEQQQEQQDQKKQQEQDQREQQQPKPEEISKEDAARLLENLGNEEEKTQEKLKLLKRKSSNVKIENDW